MTSTPVAESRGASKARSYLLVFVALGVMTAIEIAMTQIDMASWAANALFLAFSLAKAALVAAFFMHLRQDSRVYAAIFLLPVVLVLAFATLMLVGAY
jgi:cytochrome c oxidase subunit 4